jgi:hypothetical protein
MKTAKKCFTYFAFLMFLSTSTVGWGNPPQPVPIPEEGSVSPQLSISGVGIVTGTFGRNAQQDRAQPGVDYSDSTLQIGAAQRLYGSSIGSMSFGMLTLGDQNSGQSALFLTQAFVDYQAENLEVLIGRSDNPTAHVVDFPTLRDDDLFTLTNPLNPFSGGATAQDHRYSNVVEVTLNQGQKYFQNFHAQQLIDSSNALGVGPRSNSGINSFGALFQYLTTPGLEAFARFPSLGIGFEHITSVASATGGLYQLFGGGVMNLNESVTDRWDFRVQDVMSLGSDLRVFSFVQDTFVADSNAVSAALRHLHSPFGKPSYQLSLTLGYKSYFKVDQAASAGFALTALKRLGEGFHLVMQYQGQWRDQALSVVQASGQAFEQLAQVGLILNWEATFNRHLSPRRSILNQQYQYISN